MLDFLLEMGTEEIPARFLADTEKELETRFNQALTEAGLTFDKIETCSTPRRAVVSIKNLSEMQPLKEEIFTGPGEKIAFAEDKSLTKAGQGFLRGHGATEKDIFIHETEKGRYIAIKKQVGGLSAQAVLSQLCPQILSALPFPKKMRWHMGNNSYARPVQWIVALLNDHVVPFSFAGVNSGNVTFGHRIHGHGGAIIGKAQDYFKIMDKECVIVKSAERRKIIEDKGNAQAEDLSGTILWKESLMKEVLGLVEFPVPMIGDFDKSFLELPKEVLLTSMESHQKSFGVADAQGNLLPCFLTILNIHPTHVALVKKGWERVLRARLEDARFFWKTDKAILNNYGFDHWLEKLDKVVFLGPLGSMGDKARRLEQLCSQLASKVQLDPIIAGKAGKYAKADLVSSMVNEFDTLQGIMGGIYGKILGENEAAEAIAGQYLPAGPETPVPASDYGALLSLADKADTLVGLFGLNNIPSGTADPFALRRCAIGIARILREKKWNIHILSIFSLAQSLYSENVQWKLSKGEALEKLVEFYHGRVKNLFLTEGYDIAYVDAVLSVQDISHIYALSQKLNALIQFSKHEKFHGTVQSYKRISNILKKQQDAKSESPTVRHELFEGKAEEDLAFFITQHQEHMTRSYNAGDYASCFALLAESSPFIDAFFDNTMIMAENPEVRANRLNLLSLVLVPLTLLADFSALQL